jgi:hypothetical protein
MIIYFVAPVPDKSGGITVSKLQECGTGFTKALLSPVERRPTTNPSVGKLKDQGKSMPSVAFGLSTAVPDSFGSSQALPPLSRFKVHVPEDRTSSGALQSLSPSRFSISTSLMIKTKSQLC